MLQNVWMEQHVLFSPIALSIPSPVSCQKIDSTSSTLFFFLFLRVLTWINHHILRKNWRISQVLHNNWSCFWVRKFPFSIFRSWIFKKREILQGRAFWINTVRYRPIESLKKIGSSRTRWIVLLIHFWYSVCDSRFNQCRMNLPWKNGMDGDYWTPKIVSININKCGRVVDTLANIYRKLPSISGT